MESLGETDRCDCWARMLGVVAGSECLKIRMATPILAVPLIKHVL